MPDKEQFRKQVEVGVEYAKENVARNKITGEMYSLPLVDYLTDHLWGTVGMWLQNAQQIDRREFGYNAPERTI